MSLAHVVILVIDDFDLKGDIELVIISIEMVLQLVLSHYVPNG